MGRSKPRTNRRPPPRSMPVSRQSQEPTAMPLDDHRPSSPSLQSSPSPLHVHGGQPPLAMSRSHSAMSSQSRTALPPLGQRGSSPAQMDPHAPISVPISSEADLSSALHTWSTSALGRIDSLPKLTQSQLSAIAGAAAGIGEHQGGLPIDLPASLAALFEAKLTLDREKAKLVRMQKELKGYRDGVAAVSGNAAAVGGDAGSVNASASGSGRTCTGTGSGSGSGSQRSNQNGTSWRPGISGLYSAASKGKGVASDMDDDCHCGQRHSPVHEEYSEDEECYDCECDCHYIECEHDDDDHDENCDCDCGLDGYGHEHEYYEDEDEDDDHQYHQNHQHHHNHNHTHSNHNGSLTPHRSNNTHSHTHSHSHPHPHPHPQHTCEPVTIPNPYLAQNQKDPSAQMSYQQALKAYRDERDSAARGLDEIGGMFEAAGWKPRSSRPPKPLSQDPERLDEAVRELFNWIKAVVWTIEQAAIVAGRRRA